jgi:3-oxoacyl-(acyl-carrier-protein) synthase
MTARRPRLEPVVITGIGLVTSVGQTRESTWRAVQSGKSGVGLLHGLPELKDGFIPAAMVDLPEEVPRVGKAIRMAKMCAAEAMADARMHPLTIDRDRFGCAVASHMGNISYVNAAYGRPDLDHPDAVPWYTELPPNTACVHVAHQFGLQGPRLCHSAACASGSVEILTAVRTIQDGQADAFLVGGAEAIHPLLAAGFKKMRVLAEHDDPRQACRPFDRDRNGFVMGEGAAMMVLERRDHALARGARIYGEIIAGKMFSEGLHVTGLDAQSEALSYTITAALRAGDVAPDEIGYINVHGTGTEQNDACEAQGLRSSLGRAIDSIPVSSLKSMLGHTVNAAGAVEMALTMLALRDGFMPPTINLDNPDPACQLEHLPWLGRSMRPDIALKLSVAFGGHLVALLVRRWNDSATGFAYPGLSVAAA